MPSTRLLSQSGGVGLVSGAVFSGSPFPVGGLQLKLAKLAPGAVYVGLPPSPVLSGVVSGIAVTQTSGGSLTSGGMMDGMELNPGDAYRVDRVRLPSGIQSIQIAVPAASSGAVLFWEPE